MNRHFLILHRYLLEQANLKVVGDRTWYDLESSSVSMRQPHDSNAAKLNLRYFVLDQFFSKFSMIAFKVSQKNEGAHELYIKTKQNRGTLLLFNGSKIFSLMLYIFFHHKETLCYSLNFLQFCQKKSIKGVRPNHKKFNSSFPLVCKMSSLPQPSSLPKTHLNFQKNLSFFPTNSLKFACEKNLSRLSEKFPQQTTPFHKDADIVYGQLQRN